MDFLTPFITLAIAAFIWCLVTMHLSGGSAKRIAPSLTREQHDLSGSWEATAGDRNFRLAITLNGQFFQGTIVDGASSHPVEGSYIAPQIKFDTGFADGSELTFSGDVSADGCSISGTFSDFTGRRTWSAVRSSEQLSVQFAQRAAADRKQQQAVQLVYDALDNAINSTLSTALSHTMNELAAHVASPTTGRALAQSDTIDFAPAVTPVIKPAVNPVPVPIQVPVRPAVANLNPAPNPAPQSTVTPGTRKCPRCGSQWQESFTFCLHCGYVS